MWTKFLELEEELRLARSCIPHGRGRDTPITLGIPVSNQTREGTSGRRRDQSPFDRDDGRNVHTRRSAPVDTTTKLARLLQTLEPNREDSPSMSDEVATQSSIVSVTSAPAVSLHRPPALSTDSRRGTGHVRPRNFHRSTAHHSGNQSLRPSSFYPSHQRPRPFDNFRR